MNSSTGGDDAIRRQFVVQRTAATDQASPDAQMIVAGISISDSASEVERQAATVLQSCFQQMSGREIPLFVSDDSRAEADGTVLVGLPCTNPSIGALVRSRKIRNPERSAKSEGFVIETLIDGGLSMLIITGRGSEGVRSGIYHLLREVLGVEFNGDSPRVPTRTSLTVPELSIASI